jgi:hypothetical protein
MSNRRVKIGADPFPPYQYFDDQGVLRGEDYEKVKKAATEAGFEPEFILDDWAVIERNFNDNNLDAVFQLPVTPEREKKNYLFSKLLRNGKTEVATSLPDQGIKDLSGIDLEKYSLGLVEGVSYGDDIAALKRITRKFFKNNDDLIISIGKGETSFGIFDEGVKRFLMEKLSVRNINAIDALTFSRPLFMAFRDKKIRDLFDKYL